MDNFSSCKVCFLEDLISSPESFMKDLFEFLKIQEDFEIQNAKKFNITGETRIRALDKLLRKPDPVKALLPGVHKLLSDDKKNKIIEKLIGLNTKTSHEMKDPDRDYLKKIFREDITETGKLLNKDLSHWID